LRGVTVRIDRFGNIVTNVDRKSCEKLSGGGTSALRLIVGGQPISRIVSTYADIGAGEVAALFGSTDHLEVAMHASSAAERLGLGVGAPVELTRS